MTAICAATQPGGDADARARAFIHDHETEVRPLEIEIGLRWWAANVSGTDEDYRAKQEAETRLELKLADRARFAELQAIREARPADKILARELDLLYLQYLPRQVDPDLLKRVLGRSNAVEKGFNVYRARVHGEEQPDTPVSALQLYGETDITFISARTPRFDSSTIPHLISLQVNAGKKLRVSVGGGDRSAMLHIETPKGDFTLGEGSYTLAVDANRTEITVSRGQAQVTDPLKNESLVLTDFQSTVLTAEGLGEILTTDGQNDLLRDGNFDQELSPYWEAYTRAKEFVNESEG